MAIAELLTTLRRQDIKLWLDGERLCYSAPQGALTPVLRGQLSERRGELIAFLRQATSAGRFLSPPVSSLPRNRQLPLSFAQQRLWFLDQLEPHNAFYSIPSAVQMTGRLNEAALEQTISEIVRRHEVLRTTFTAAEGRPIQVIAPAQAVTLPIVDLTSLPEAEREAEARRQACEQAQLSFRLDKGPLFRCTLFKLAAETHALLLITHHIISDGWSIGVLIQELSSLYQTLSAGTPSPLPELAIQYADFAHWQREWLQGEVLETQLAYWRQQVGGSLPVLELPTDRPRPAVQTFRGANHSLRLSKALTDSLNVLSNEENTTLFMTLLAAFTTLLHRYSGQEDIIVGSPVANRQRVDIEGLIGCFVNTLALRTNLSGNPSFRELLGRVRQVALGAAAHQDLPFEKLLHELQPDRDLSRNPLFEVMFVLQNTPQSSQSLPGLTLNALEVSKGAVQFDLELTLLERPEGLRGFFEYNSGLFDASTIARMAGHFQTLLAGIVADADLPISDLPLLTEAERHQSVVVWNSTRADYPNRFCFCELFEAQAERTPDATAVVCEDEHLSYRQLNQRANQLAWALVERGIGPEVIVNVVAERGIDFLVAVLAIFKAGGAYVPLDPHIPAKRLQQMQNQSQAQAVLAADTLEPALQQILKAGPAGKGPQIWAIEELIRQQPARQNLPSRSTPRNLAYVIYTSGSLGLMKGAMVEQLGMLSHLFAKIRELELTKSDIVAQTASQSFDISVWQSLAVLLVGGQISIFSDEDARNPLRLLEQVGRTAITVLETVPSLLRALLEEVRRHEPHLPDVVSLRWLILTGEALAPELCRSWLRYYPHTRLLNAYGPTECSDDVTHFVIREPLVADMMRVPVGRPIMNMQLYVLSPRLHPAPIGLMGELFAGGVGVGRGYLGEAERTAEGFVPDPFAVEPGRRLYKTGDLCRYLPDGNIDFLGRIDHQLKVRGYRIEAGEVESALAQHSAVQESVVITRKDRSQEMYLVAYVVPRKRQIPTIRELRSFLKQLLPAYMVPSAFVLLDALPLNANGKRDRSALPAPEEASPGREEPFVVPRSPVEDALAAIWSEVLGREQVSIHDSFFELGGHSLLATQVISRVREVFGVEIPVRALFDEPTVAGLAVTITQNQSRTMDDLQRIARIDRGESEQLLKNVDQLSDEEVDALLRNRSVGMNSEQSQGDTPSASQPERLN